MMSRAQSPEPEGPKPIHRLQEQLINRIAAGEIIHRPASALKELIENSLDAGSTSIRVTVKDGGMKLLQIQDNGCGIRKADLPILAERFTTSKLSTFSDLQSLRTYGFRGEALASISHVAYLTVTTKTKKDNCAWKAFYLDGALASQKAGQAPDLKPCAGTDGTTITAENLFYNTPTRLAALRSSSEEYTRILDVMTKYAVHNPTVAFVCKKAGSPSSDLSTPSGSTISQTIRLLYGQSIARELIQISLSSDIQEGEEDQASNDLINSGEEAVQWKGEALITNANYQAKRMSFLLFINHRLVESSRIKRAIEGVYNTLLPKGMSPFVYLSLEIDPRAVDVNVHPTKREVHFLNEDAIIDRVANSIQRTLAEQSGSRTFEYQTLLTGGVLDDSHGKAAATKGKGKQPGNSENTSGDEDDNNNDPTAAQKIKPAYSKDKIRVSQADRTLDSMFPVLNPETQPRSVIELDKIQDEAIVDEGNDESTKYRSSDAHAKSRHGKDVAPSDSLPNKKRGRAEADESSNIDSSSGSSIGIQAIEESECFLTSVSTLRKDVVKSCHQGLTEILQKHVFVGIVDLKRSLSLIQHELKLYLVNHAALSEELFYQLAVRQFGNFARLKLEPPPKIHHLINLAVSAEDNRWKASGLDIEKDEVVNRIVSKLKSSALMLEEYFSFTLTENGELTSIPLLLRGYTPDLSKLPLFLMRLGPQVCWTKERECFESFLRELAYFYAAASPLDDTKGNEESSERAERWQIEHTIFPCMRRYLQAPKSLLERDVVQVASLPDLYRVFERC